MRSCLRRCWLGTAADQRGADYPWSKDAPTSSYMMNFHASLPFLHIVSNQ